MGTTFILAIIVLLFVLAISDLVVGVSNDAVNFLNSAIGSKVAPYRVILLVAISGIIIGSLFSSGIMEIARKGIFNPQYFTFDKLLYVFLAVMLTDIILLDIFNTMGLPTSTTVSIVFELLGAAFIVGILITFDTNASINDAFKYINFDSTGSIISGIFLSIFIAFTAGIVIHYLTRLVFTFQYQNKLSRYGAIYAGLGLSAIVYFLLIKGLKGTSLINPNTNLWIAENTPIILVVLFVISTIISFVLQKYRNVNPLKVVVLAGTFSLAMAFAGNDLVNFIGVPITGFLAYQNWMASGLPADELYQDFLASSDVIVPNYMLLIAGIVMGLTIWLSAKAKKVTETEVNLGRQGSGDERFKPNEVSRNIVKTGLRLSGLVGIIIPQKISDRYNISLQKSKLKKATKTLDTSAFDLVRASSNLVIASILIAWATSMKLPLSTTYVSFMVAMGSSLADRAWGKDSAVYRVAGVMSVIGGWFITAFIAFTVAGLFAFILYKGGMAGTIVLTSIVVAYLVASHISFNRKEKASKDSKDDLAVLDNPGKDFMAVHRNLTADFIKTLSKEYNTIYIGIRKGDKDILKKANKNMENLLVHARKIQNKSLLLLPELPDKDNKVAETLIYSNDMMIDLAQSVQTMSIESLNYVKNLQNIPSDRYFETLEVVRKRMDKFFSGIYGLLVKPVDSLDDISKIRKSIRSRVNEELENQIENVYNETQSVNQSVFQTTLLLQTRDIQAVLIRLARVYFDYDKRP